MARNRDVLAMLFLASWPFVYFWPVTLGHGVWYTTDILRLYLPFGVELSRALNDGRLPLWTPNIQAGFPLLAEGHVAALYPVYLLLFKVLPPHFAISYGMLLHLAWAACGMYACARATGLRTAGALLAGFVFSFNGFMLEKLYHTPIIVTSSWLPWMIFFQTKFQRARNHNKPLGVWFFLTALAVGFQLAAGFPQIALLSAIAFALFGFFGELLWNRAAGDREVRCTSEVRRTLHLIAQAILWTLLPLVLGSGIAAIQLLPTGELVGYSVRGSALSESFLTEYSLPPTFLTQFFAPYAQGEPIEHTNEYLAYFGLVPFILAIIAPFLRRDHWTIFCYVFALSALSLALGNLNPAYQLVYRLPIFGLFRTPARYIFLFLFAAAFLSASAFEELSNRLAPSIASSKKIVGQGGLFALLTLGSIWLAYTQPLDFWLKAQQALPWLLGLFAIITIGLAWTRKIERGTFGAVVIGLTIFDLASYAPPFLLTMAAITPPSYVEGVPRSVSVLVNERSIGRVFTDTSVVPAIPAYRGSLYPNIGMMYGQESAQANSPLVFARHEAYLSDLSPTLLNLVNVRYFLVPLEPRFTNKSVGPFASLSLDIVNNEVFISPTRVTAVELVSFTEQAANLAEGTVVGAVELRLSDGKVEAYLIRVGNETADWDYDRKSALGAAKHSRARVAHSFPAYWRSFGRSFEGHAYLARFDVAPAGQTRDIIGVSVRTLLPDVHLTVEDVRLVDDNSNSNSLASLTHKNNFSLVFLSDTVAVWENLDVMPRAFIVHAAEVLKESKVDPFVKTQFGQK